MTSTGINVGLKDNCRNSSRVLRPPGGGHTNLFGDVEDSKPARKDHGRNASSILEGTNSQPASPTSPVKNIAPQPEPVPQMNTEAAPQQQSRGRVPPGGFSKGLW